MSLQYLVTPPNVYPRAKSWNFEVSSSTHETSATRTRGALARAEVECRTTSTLMLSTLLVPRLVSPRVPGGRSIFITANEPSFDAWSLPALLPNVFTNGGESVVNVVRAEVYSEKLGWVTQIRGIEVTPAGVELGLATFALLLYSRLQRERKGWLPRAEEEEEEQGEGR